MEILSKKNFTVLSKRELEILNLIFDDMSSAEISAKLFISKHTVDTHRKNILRKTSFKSITSLLKFAIKNKII